MENAAELDPVPPEELDPRIKPFWKPEELRRLGLGHHALVLAAIKAGEIPAVRVGRKRLIPTVWIRRQIQLPDVDPDPPVKPSRSSTPRKRSTPSA